MVALAAWQGQQECESESEISYLRDQDNAHKRVETQTGEERVQESWEERERREGAERQCKLRERLEIKIQSRHESSLKER